MKTQPYPGKCHICGEIFSRRTMPRHLSQCKPPEASASSSQMRSQETGKSFHLVIEGRYANAYWLHVAVPEEAPLSSLDYFLRQIWVECCEHLSAFTIGGRRYAYHPMADLGERSMRVPVGKVLEVGAKFSYEYDYGSTTELTLRVVGLRARAAPSAAVQLLARNEPPRINCDQCRAGKLATQICTECVWSGRGWLCDDCAATHLCGSGTFLPVVNSPRVGVCGYTG